MMNVAPTNAKETLSAAGGYGPPGGGYGGGAPPPFGGGGGGGGRGPAGSSGGWPPGGGYGGPPLGAPGGFGPPGGFPPPGGPMTPGGSPEVNTTLPLILNAIAALGCFWGGLSFVIAIVGIVFAVQAMNAQKMGDFGQARDKAKLAIILAIVAYVVSIPVGIWLGMLFFGGP